MAPVFPPTAQRNAPLHKASQQNCIFLSTCTNLKLICINIHSFTTLRELPLHRPWFSNGGTNTETLANNILINSHVTNYDNGAMPSATAGRRMKTSTMLLLNFILHPSQQSLQVCLLQIRYAYSTKGCWIPFAFIYEQANFWWLVGRTKYNIGSPPRRRPPAPHTPPTMHAIAEKGLFMYSTSQLCSSSASRIMDLINKLIWAIRGAAAAHSLPDLPMPLGRRTLRCNANYPCCELVKSPRNTKWSWNVRFAFTWESLKVCQGIFGARWASTIATLQW